MRICIVSLNLAAYFDHTPRGRYGGAEVQAAFVARALTTAGHDVSLVLADLHPDVHPPYPTRTAFDSSEGIPGLRFLHPRMTGIMRALAEADADVYYQRNAGMLTGLTAQFCRRRERTFVYGAGSDTDFSFARVLIDNLRDRTLYYHGLKHADGVVVQNEAQRAMAAGVIRRPLRVIPNGATPPDQVSARDDGPIVWAGGIRRIKRPELFVELARRIPDRSFVLIGGGLAGEGRYADDVARSARSLANMEVTGWRPHAEVIRQIREAALVVNTSEAEGFPNVYLEAWNHGVPVITFIDVDDLIARERVGAVCTSIDEMESTVRTLLAEPARLNEMRERARRLVAERFSPAVLGPRYAEFFQELRDGRKRR